MKLKRIKGFLIPLTLLFSGLFYVFFIFRSSFIYGGSRYFTLFDDAMISMRYARNLAQGKGLVWNPHEYIEGYTNFLWTIWLSFLHLFNLGDAKTPLLVDISTACILIANGLLIKSIAAEIMPRKSLSYYASILLTLTFYGLIYWTLRGMEVGLISMLINAAVLLSIRLSKRFLQREFLLLLLIMGTMLLVRTDSIISFFILSFFFLSGAQKGERLKSAAALLMVLLVFLGGHTLFRYLYYHDSLPNTYYLKVGGLSTLTRIKIGFSYYQHTLLFEILPFFIPLIFLLFFKPSFFLRRDFLLLLFLFGGFSVYSIYVGGDAWEEMTYPNRYISTTISDLILLSCMGLEYICSNRRLVKNFSLSLSIGLLAAVILIPIFGQSSSVHHAFLGLFSVEKMALIAVMLAYAIFCFFTYLDFERSTRSVTKQVKSNLLFPVFLLAFMILTTSGFSYYQFFKANAHHVDDDINMTKLGLDLLNKTPDSTRIAFVWAGTAPYISHRYGIDLLGKMDPVIAHGPSKPIIDQLGNIYYKPGHTKWNYQYSIGHYRPDLILQVFQFKPADLDLIKSLGYSANATNLSFTFPDDLNKYVKELISAPAPYVLSRNDKFNELHLFLKPRN